MASTSLACYRFSPSGCKQAGFRLARIQKERTAHTPDPRYGLYLQTSPLIPSRCQHQDVLRYLRSKSKFLVANCMVMAIDNGAEPSSPTCHHALQLEVEFRNTPKIQLRVKV